jgi:uncharacterized protein
MYKEQVEYLAKLLVDNPDQVVVETIDQPDAVTLKLHVARGDLGRVIGKQGRTARAIRTLLYAAGARARRLLRSILNTRQVFVMRLHRDKGLPIIRLGELIFLHDRTVAEWLLAQQSTGPAGRGWAAKPLKPGTS